MKMVIKLILISYYVSNLVPSAFHELPNSISTLNIYCLVGHKVDAILSLFFGRGN